MINSEGRRNPDLGNRRRDDDEIADYDEKVRLTIRLTITLTPMILLILPSSCKI